MHQFTSLFIPLTSLLSPAALGSIGGGSSLLHCLCAHDEPDKDKMRTRNELGKSIPGQSSCLLQTANLLAYSLDLEIENADQNFS